MSTATKVARAAGKKRVARTSKAPVDGKKVEFHPRSPTSPWTGVDGDAKWQVRSAMAKKKGGGASRRGSHRLADAGSGCEVRWYWSHFVKLKPLKGNFYMDFGTLMHTAAAYHYAEMMERRPEWFIESPDMEAALLADSLGNAKWLRDVKTFLEWYKRFDTGDPVHPIYCEEEFEATVGALDPDGQDEPAEDIVTDTIDPETGEKKVIHLPTLNDEIVTCRPDLINERNGDNWIWDHKSASAGRDGSGRLKVLDDRYPDYTYVWQAMVNLHIVRQTIPIRGFIFNRLKRDAPYDCSRDLFTVPARTYAKVPRTIRECVKRERSLLRKSVTAKSTLVSAPWECKGAFACSYVRVCHNDSLEERDAIIQSEFHTGE